MGVAKILACRRSVIMPLLRCAGLLDYFEDSLIFGSETFDHGGALASLGGNAHKGHVLSRLVAPAVLPTGYMESEELLLSELAPPLVNSLVAAPLELPQHGRVVPSSDGTSSILFVDDMPDNCMDVHAACASCATLLVPEYTAIRSADVAAIRAWAQPDVPAAAQTGFEVFD